MLGFSILGFNIFLLQNIGALIYCALMIQYILNNIRGYIKEFYINMV